MILSTNHFVQGAVLGNVTGTMESTQRIADELFKQQASGDALRFYQIALPAQNFARVATRANPAIYCWLLLLVSGGAVIVWARC